MRQEEVEVGLPAREEDERPLEGVSPGGSPHRQGRQTSLQRRRQDLGPG